MARRRKKRSGVRSIYSFAITWLILSAFFPLSQLWGLLATLGICSGVAYLFGRSSARREAEQEASAAQAAQPAPKAEVKEPPLRQTAAQPAAKTGTVSKKSYGPEVDPIIQEGNKALSEMGRLYQSIREPEIRQKINELMRITDKIIQDAIADPSDIPQIKKFMNYYLPTTLKLLNTYDRMSAQGIEGENLGKTMKSITDMLDDAIEAYKKMLDSLFADQAMDIETEIQVMNTMLAREGLTGTKDFDLGGAAGQAQMQTQ